MKLDIRNTAFSRYGSYFVITEYDDGVWIRDIRGGDEDRGRIFKIDLLDSNGEVEEYRVEANETLLKLIGETSGQIFEMCMPKDKYIRCRGKGNIRLSLEFKKYDHLNPHSKDRWELHSYSQQVKMMLTLLSGNIVEDTPWEKIGNTKVELTFNDFYDFRLESYITVAKNSSNNLTFEEEHAKVSEEYRTWYENTIKNSNKKHIPSRKLASYITWSAMVSPCGMIHKPAMYMSNNWMMNIWSWDNCFNAMAMARNNPSLAYDQFIFFKKYQDESGVLPDYVNDKTLSYACCKPPIHGWTYSYMMKENDFFKDTDRLAEVYDMLSKWTNYWFNHRVRNGLFYYNHGNDSGWDNASVFAKGCPVASPDLYAYMILQLETLGEIATLLRRDSSRWIKLANEVQDTLIEKFWNGNRFITHSFKIDGEVEDTRSLINLMPIVIAHRLPDIIKDKLIEDLSNKNFFTDFGFATEAIDSKYYAENGYWRGPIWAPTTMLIIDGLTRCNEIDFATKASEKFCNMTLIGKMAENYDPLNGRGLVDPSFTWTSSVFLMLSERV